MRFLRALGRALVKPRTLRSKPARRSRRRQRGIALLVVLIAIAITITITNQFGTATVTDSLAAANYRDQMRSHFLARSALNLSELIIRIQQRLDNGLAGSGASNGAIQITDFADQLMLAFCGGEEEVQAAIGFSTSVVKGLGADVGTCGVVGRINTDDDKININCANGNDTVAAAVKSELDSLMYYPLYDQVFEEPDAEGWRRDRQTQAAAIVDYIDKDTSRVRERGTTEDYGYENLKDPYYAKNNYIDTVDELKLVRGVDDRFWTLFGEAFTAYGACKVNLSAISNVQLLVALLYIGAKNATDPMLANPQKMFQLASLIVKARSFGMTFDSTKDFVDFVKDPAASVAAMMGGGGATGSASSSAASALIPTGDKLGLELDPAKIDQIARTGARRTYRLEAWGEIPRPGRDPKGQPLHPPIRSTITGVWDTKVVNQNVRKPPMPNGAWVYLKEE